MTVRARNTILLAALTATIAVPFALAGSTAKGFTITSTLDGKTVLPLRIPWIAHPRIPQVQVKKIDFFIDGRRAWTEHHAPYTYGDDGNRLVTTFLKPGLHTFTVRALTATGKAATDTVKARVIAAPAPPAKLAGAWTRIVTPADLKKGPPGPPAGRWTITVTSIGWSTGPHDNFDVRYLPNGNIVMGPEVVTPVQQTGAFCGVDPLHTWTVSLSPDDKSMQLNPSGKDSCGDRVAIMQGTWTRAN
jgi:hypothetical protein